MRFTSMRSLFLVISRNFKFLCKMMSWVHDVLGVVISSTRRAQSPECVHKALYAIACTKPCMRAQCVFPFEVKRNTLHPKRFQKVFTWLCIQTMTTDMRWIHSVSESRVLLDTCHSGSFLLYVYSHAGRAYYMMLIYMLKVRVFAWLSRRRNHVKWKCLSHLVAAL